MTRCRLCPRLVAWREEVARTKRAAFRDETYWGKPVAGFGDPAARLLIVGLAPAAHGANRTGRPFTGDRSGEWLYDALHRAGFANQAESISRDDGLNLSDAYVTACARCAPPKNRPSPEEMEHCRPYLEREIDLLGRLRVILCLGQIAFTQVMRLMGSRGATLPRPRPRFRHGAEVILPRPFPVLLASYHPSQQNTFTGRLTRPMLRSVFRLARKHLP